MNNILTINNVRGYINKEGIAQLSLEDCARGLGFIEKSASGNETIRWRSIVPHLICFGTIATSCDALPTYIPENIFYRLAMKANNKVAEKFQAVVCDEILPSIRKNGLYATDAVIDRILDNPDYGIALLTKLKEERSARVEAERKNAILMHVNKTYTMTEIAKELNLKSAIQLNNILSDKKIQFKQNGTWILYSKYSSCGYEELKQEVLDNGKVIYHRKITQLGRDFILNLVGGI